MKLRPPLLALLSAALLGAAAGAMRAEDELDEEATTVEVTVEQGADPFTGAVVPARGGADSSLLGELNRVAKRELRRHDFDLASEFRVGNALSSTAAGVDPGESYTDKQLFQIGEELEVDLVVHPRIIARSGKPDLLELVSARVSREVVWRCRRPLEVTGEVATINEAAEHQLEFCLDQLLYPEPDAYEWRKLVERREPRKQIERTWRKKHYIGFSGQFVPWGVQKLAIERGGDRLVGYIDYGPSGGVGLFYENRVVPAVAAGVQAEYMMLWEQGATRTTGNFGYERMSLANLGATVRVLYPGQWAEPYAKLVLGFSIVGPPDEPQNGTALLKPGFGTNYQIRLGNMFTFPLAGFFIEAGFFVTPWFPSDAVVRNDEGEAVSFDEITGVEAGVLIDFGLVTMF
jgi:hypothetical protein